jgi:hypothetical protein
MEENLFSEKTFVEPSYSLDPKSRQGAKSFWTPCNLSEPCRPATEMKGIIEHPYFSTRQAVITLAGAPDWLRLAFRIRLLVAL